MPSSLRNLWVAGPPMEPIDSPVPGALSPYRILDLSTHASGYGSKLLADMGADVIKLEPVGGDPERNVGPFFGGIPGPTRSLSFAYFNINKRSVTMNLDNRGGQDLFRRLVLAADVVYETFPPGYLADRGLGYHKLSALNPKIIVISLTPFGQTGPRREWKGSDLVAWASSGLLYTIGDEDRAPVVPPGMLGLLIGSLYAAAGTLLALRTRRRSGRGQHVDISLQECAVSVSSECGLPLYLDDGVRRVRVGSQRQTQVPVGHFETQDGAAAFVVSMPDHWDAFAAWVNGTTGNQEILDPTFRGGSVARVPYKDKINPIVQQFAQRFKKQELFEEAQRRGIPISPVNNAADIARDPQLEVRRFWLEFQQPGVGLLKVPGLPFRLMKSPGAFQRPAPTLGEHNRDIYRGELGLTEQEFSDLQAAKDV